MRHLHGDNDEINLVAAAQFFRVPKVSGTSWASPAAAADPGRLSP
jgi:hypothetical protein